MIPDYKIKSAEIYQIETELANNCLSPKRKYDLVRREKRLKKEIDEYEYWVFKKLMEGEKNI